MAPATPSPRRFLQGSHRRASPGRDSRPASSLRHEVLESNPNASAFHTHEQRHDFPPSQFAGTPRFSFGRPGLPPRSPSSPKSTFARALKTTRPRAEDVEDVPDEPSTLEDAMLDVEQTRSPLAYNAHDPGLVRSDLPFSPKRRRLDPDDVDARSLSVDQTLAQVQSLDHQRVPRFAPSQASEIPGEADAKSHRLPFLRPSAMPSEPVEPLPQAFSPHRRGQKFVPGGMAAMVQQWVVETGQAAVQSRRGQSYMRGDDYVLQIKVEEVNGNGPFVALAKCTSGDVLHMLLARQGGSGHSSTAVVVAGSVLGVRAPVWDVEIGGSMWCVGVDWRILP